MQKSTYQAELEKQQVNVELLLKTIMVSENKQNRNITLSFSKQCGYIQTNEFAFTTVLTNLINNALYYSPETTPVIIAVRPEKNTNKIRLDISNVSSFEYSEQDLTMFFEPLWQKDSSRTSEERYGLGLAIVKSYCERIGAILDVAIAPDQSITFTIII